MNIVHLSGYIGRDPETRFTTSGVAVCTFSLATSKKVKGENKTSWHKIKCFNKTAELCQKYFFKGSFMILSGEIDYSDWTDKEGVKKYMTEIIANNIEFGPKEAQGKPQGQTEGQGYQSGYGGYQGQQQGQGYQPRTEAPKQPENLPDDDDDSIPF